MGDKECGGEQVFSRYAGPTGWVLYDLHNNLIRNIASDKQQLPFLQLKLSMLLCLAVPNR